jgi:16S rRNA (adenine1518-N6/adenine1519-N6)-dimethyltransferase
VYFHRFLRLLFQHRRKFLRAQLLNAVAGEIDKAGVDDILETLQISPSLRAETLPPETVLTLAEAVRGKIRSER